MTQPTSPLFRALSWPARHRTIVDSSLAAVLILISVPVVIGTGYVGNAYGPIAQLPPLYYAIVVVSSIVTIAPLAIRRSRPDLSAALCYGGAALHLAFGIPLVLPADLFVPLALYSVTAYGSRRAYRIAIGGAVVGVSAVIGLGSLLGDFRWQAAVAVWIAIALVFAVAWALGLVTQARMAQYAQLAARAELAEQEQEKQARLAAANERARIAREMHDIVAHSLAVLIAQADGGRYAAPQDPLAAERALSTIAEVGRGALADMRRLLGVLRTDSDSPDSGNGAAAPPGVLPSTVAGPLASEADSPVPTSPQPDAESLPALIAQVRATGLRVSFGVTGTPSTLPPGIGLVIYRVCQEALTNILKHAGPDPGVSVMLMWAPGSVTLDVRDDGRGASATGGAAGHGVIGMKERVALTGGTMRAGPRPGGGYQVRCTIPLPSRDAAYAAVTQTGELPATAPSHSDGAVTKSATPTAVAPTRDILPPKSSEEDDSDHATSQQ